MPEAGRGRMPFHLSGRRESAIGLLAVQLMDDFFIQRKPDALNHSTFNLSPFRADPDLVNKWKTGVDCDVVH